MLLVAAVFYHYLRINLIFLSLSSCDIYSGFDFIRQVTSLKKISWEQI